jgi:hypothetical protein
MRSVGWAVTAVARRFRAATCLVQALATEAMLRQRGLACELRIGVRLRRGSSMPLEAHAWVECNGLVSPGAMAHPSDFKVLAALKSQ